MDSITFEKLKDIEARFAEVEARMSDADVARDPSAYQKLARESREISPIVDRYRAYKATLGELSKVQEMIRAEADPDMREMAHEELRLEICSSCHPFFTGKQKLIDSAGRVERYTRKYGKTTSKASKKT